MNQIDYLKKAQTALNEAFFQMNREELETLEARVIMADCRQTLRAMDPDMFTAPDFDDCPWPFSEVA